jgi:hypothetical protein
VRLTAGLGHQAFRIAGIGVAAAALFYVVVYPFTRVHYPPMTDLPFHAASASIVRHFWDPAYHFQEQFQLEPLKVPYWTHYGLTALFAVPFSIVTATKLATILLLAQLPVGLAVLFRGMKKSPVLGLLGLGFVWNTLTHWGFINFVGALGLFCMALGLTFLVLDRPTRARQIGLAVVLVLLFGTHIFRFPFAIAAVVGATVLLYPATRRWKEALVPILPALALAVLWYVRRDRDGTGPADVKPSSHLDFTRLNEIPRALFNGLSGSEELARATMSLQVLGGVCAVGLLGFLVERRFRKLSGRGLAFHVATHVVVASCAAVFFWMFLVLPMQIGVWWYVYPREVVAASFVALGLCPDLPRPASLRMLATLGIAYVAARQAELVVQSYEQFDRVSADFQRIVKNVPKAPRLGYMVFDHGGSLQVSTPFIHLPAWVQAEKGGTLSFHFVSWNQSPIRYRKDSAAVPPDTPLRFEWTPERFDINTRGRFFDTFLIRSRFSPASILAVDPTLHLVENDGTWWLFQRSPAPQN